MEFALVALPLGILPLIIFAVGVFANLMTLVSTFYAKTKRKYGFLENWNTATIYIQNLAFIDLLYCLILLIKVIYDIIMHLEHYAKDARDKHQPYKEDAMFCKIFVHLQIFLGTCDKWAIVVIAITRAVAITNNRVWENICDKRRNVVIFVLFPWIWSLGFRFLGSNEMFSRNTNTGLCMPEETSRIVLFRFMLHFPVETIIITFSYLYILCYVKGNTQASKETDTVFFDENAKSIRKRNMRLVKTMALIAFSSIFLSLPYFVVVILYEMDKISTEAFSLWGLIAYNILIVQYSNNLFIYVWRKDENMWAIMDVIALIFPKCITKTQKQKMKERIDDSNKICALVAKNKSNFNIEVSTCLNVLDNDLELV